MREKLQQLRKDYELFDQRYFASLGNVSAETITRAEARMLEMHIEIVNLENEIFHQEYKEEIA